MSPTALQAAVGRNGRLCASQEQFTGHVAVQCVYLWSAELKSPGNRLWQNVSLDLSPGAVCKNVKLMLVRIIIEKMLASSIGDHGPQDFSIVLEPQLFSGVGTVLVIYFELCTRSFIAGRRFEKITIYDMKCIYVSNLHAHIAVDQYYQFSWVLMWLHVHIASWILGCLEAKTFSFVYSIGDIWLEAFEAVLFKCK